MPDSAMTGKEEADQLAELLRGQLDHFKQTRQIEWKLNLTFWTSIVLAAGALYRANFRLDSASDRWAYAAVCLLLWAAHVSLWLVPIQYSESTDDHFINVYRKEIEKRAGAPDLPGPDFWEGTFWRRFRKWRKSEWTWVLAETWITVVVLAIIGLVLTVAPEYR